MKEKLENIEKTEDKPESAKGRQEVTKEELEDTKEQPKAAEEGLERAETATDKTKGKSVDEKDRPIRKKIAGCMELAAAVILLLISAGLFLNTRGTRLLYVSVATGRISRYYWILLVAAVILGVMGLVTLKGVYAGKINRNPALDRQ